MHHQHESIPDRRAGEFRQGKVAAGRYTSTSEVVYEALRLMENAEQQQAERLIGAAAESGPETARTLNDCHDARRLWPPLSASG